MKHQQEKLLYVLGGIAGIAGTLCYIAAISVPAGVTLSYLFAMAWPLLSIIFVFALYRYIALERQSAANQLALVFSALAFTLVAAMLSIQLAVQTGMDEHLARTPESEEMLKMIRRSLRLVDLGLDVAWDLFIGTGLTFLCFALARHNQFGYRWGIPAGVLGCLLMALNAATFPWPPDTQGLFDVGPMIGLFIIALSVRLLQLGIRIQRASNGNNLSAP